MKAFRFGAGTTAVAALFALAGWLAFGAAPAGATGTVTILQPDGSTNVYNNVSIKILHSALFVTTADGTGTLVIHRAACSYQGEILVCFATNASLVQSGKTSALDFKSGTAYINETDSSQPLTLSTQKISANSVLLSFTTKRGTYISLTGRLDQVVK